MRFIYPSAAPHDGTGSQNSVLTHDLCQKSLTTGASYGYRTDESSACCWKTSRIFKPNLRMCLTIFALRLQMVAKVSINSVVAILNVVREVVQSLRHCVTSRKVADSISGGVIEIFH